MHRQLPLLALAQAAAPCVRQARFVGERRAHREQVGLAGAAGAARGGLRLDALVGKWAVPARGVLGLAASTRLATVTAALLHCCTAAKPFAARRTVQTPRVLSLSLCSQIDSLSLIVSFSNSLSLSLSLSLTRAAKKPFSWRRGALSHAVWGPNRALIAIYSFMSF